MGRWNLAEARKDKEETSKRERKSRKEKFEKKEDACRRVDGKEEKGLKTFFSVLSMACKNSKHNSLMRRMLEPPGARRSSKQLVFTKNDPGGQILYVYIFFCIFDYNWEKFW